MSGNRWESDCRSRDREFDPGPVPYVRWDWSFSSLPLNHLRRIVVSYKRKYVREVLVNCLFKLAQETRVIKWTDRPAMTIAVDLGRKTTKQINKQTICEKQLLLRCCQNLVNYTQCINFNTNIRNVMTLLMTSKLTSKFAGLSSAWKTCISC